MIMIKLLDDRIGPEKYFWYNCDARCACCFTGFSIVADDKKDYKQQDPLTAAGFCFDRLRLA